MIAPNRQQLNGILDRFYRNPVAVVSFELVLSILAVVFFAIFAIRPTLVTMSDLIKEINDKRQLDLQMAQKIAALSNAQTNFLGMQDRTAVLDEAIPHGAQVAKTLKIVEKIASDRNLIITSLTTLEIPQDPPIGAPLDQLERRSILIQLIVTGDYQSIREFAEELRQSRRSLVIERITFVTEDIRGQKSLEASFLIGAPYFGEKQSENQSNSRRDATEDQELGLE